MLLSNSLLVLALAILNCKKNLVQLGIVRIRAINHIAENCFLHRCSCDCVDDVVATHSATLLPNIFLISVAALALATK